MNRTKTKIFESKNIYTVICNTVFSIAKEGSKSCLCAGSSRARGSKAVRRGAVPPPPCRHSRVIASTWQLELPSLCTLAAAASVAAATPNYFALVAMSRRRRGADGGGSSVRLGYSKSTQARHWCTVAALVQSTTTPPLRCRCRRRRVALLCLRSSTTSTSAARLVAACRGGGGKNSYYRTE